MSGKNKLECLSLIFYCTSDIFVMFRPLPLSGAFERYATWVGSYLAAFTRLKRLPMVKHSIQFVWSNSDEEKRFEPLTTPSNWLSFFSLPQTSGQNKLECLSLANFYGTSDIFVTFRRLPLGGTFERYSTWVRSCLIRLKGKHSIQFVLRSSDEEKRF
jgi:hypothetical protein